MTIKHSSSATTVDNFFDRWSRSGPFMGKSQNKDLIQKSATTESFQSLRLLAPVADNYDKIGGFSLLLSRQAL